ncbi:hypothetical protein Ndes2437B_g02023 [Nannochloris sp. 'desiccata']
MLATTGKMNRIVMALGVVLAFACILGSVNSHSIPQYSIKIAPRKSGRTLLHTLPVQTELQHLSSTLGALANADGRRADLLLHKAAGEAWNAAQIVANPLMEATSPAFSARRRLQQLAQVAPLKSPELDEWLSKAGEFWQARAQQGQSLVKAQDFLKNFMQGPLASLGAPATTTATTPSIFPRNFDLGNIQLPQLSPDALKSVTQFLNTTAKSFMLSQAISGMFDQAITDVGKSFSKYRIKPPAGSTAANTRRLQQAVNDKENVVGGTLNASSVDVTAEDVIKALQQLERAAGIVGGPASSVDLQFSGGDSKPTASMKRRLLASADGDINAFSTQLQQQVKEAVATWQRLDHGAVISSDEVKTWLASRAAGLKQRFEDLKTRFEAAANSEIVSGGSTKRHLLEKSTKNPAAAAPAAETDEEIFDDYDFSDNSNRSPVAYSTSTVLLLMTPADAEASTAFIDDVLNFLMDTLTSSRVTPDGSSAFSPQAFDLAIPMYRANEDEAYFNMYDPPAAENAADYGGDENDELLQLLMESVTAAAARGPEQYGTAMAMEFPSGIPTTEPTSKRQQDLTIDEAVAKGLLLNRRRRRQLLGLDSAFAYDAELAEDFLDSEYAQEEAWYMISGDDDWMSPEASIEEAVLQYADEANESELLDLVVKLVAPIDDHGEGISPVLLEMLLDPANASVAQLLKELASGPAGGEINVAKQSGIDAAIPPRFAVFGPSVVAGFGQAAAVGAHLPRPLPQIQQRDSNNNGGKMVDMVVAPLRGPKPHTERDMPSGMDARWWGVVLGLGGLGLLIVGAAAVAAMKPAAADVRDGEDSIQGGGRGGTMGRKGGYETVPASPQMSTSPWENKGQVAKAKASSGASRKTSNLPA